MKKLVVIACIVLVFIASIDGAETEMKKKKKKSKKVKNVQADAAREPQAQQPAYDYPENYDDYNDYDENDNNGSGVSGERKAVKAFCCDFDFQRFRFSFESTTRKSRNIWKHRLPKALITIRTDLMRALLTEVISFYFRKSLWCQ